MSGTRTCLEEALPLPVNAVATLRLYCQRTDEALGMSSLKALESCTWCNSLAIESVNVLSKGRTVRAAFICWPCLLIISRTHCFGARCPGSCTSAQPPPLCSGCSGQRCCSSAGLSSQGTHLVQLPKEDLQGRGPEILADKLG